MGSSPVSWGSIAAGSKFRVKPLHQRADWECAMSMIVRSHFPAQAVFLPAESPTAQPRVEGLFKKYEEDLCRRTHQLFSWLLVLQWAFCIFIAGIWSPRSWAGRQTLPHAHLFA